MSGIVAIYDRRGRPVNPIVLEQMVHAMAHRGPDGMTRWVHGPMGLGHCLMHTTPESLNEHQPIRDEGERYHLIWDGRLDNRHDLIAALTAAGVPCGAETDPELVLGAYRLWGMRCVERILGEFAFVIWDAQTRTLFGARDRIGFKPFYYTEQGSTLLIASEAKGLLAVLDRMPDPDDELILAMLLAECREPDNHRSLFAGIHRLPPGHLMLVERGQLRLERYWQIDPTKQIRYKRPEAYVEHFRALFEEAVRCRTRSAFPVGCFLSGGLDSSAITMMAASCGQAVEAFTSFSSEDPASDERRYARMVCQAAGIPLWEFASQPHTPLAGLEDLLWKVECPLVGTNRETERFATLVRSRNCRIVLDGEGADQLMDEFGYLADVLLHRGPLSFVRETSRFAQWYGEPTRDFARIALQAMAPTSLKFLGKRILRRIPPSWIAEELACSVGLAARIHRPRVPITYPWVCQTHSHQEALSPYLLLKLELAAHDAAWSGQEPCYPFLDSRLVEFILSIPWNQRSHQGERNWLLRQAMQEVLPQEICQRRGKGDWTNEMDQALVALCRLDPPEPLVNRSGMTERYLNLNGARQLITQYLKGKRSLRWEVWGLVTFDYWLKRFWKEGRRDGEEHLVERETVHPTEAAPVR